MADNPVVSTPSGLQIHGFCIRGGEVLAILSVTAPTVNLDGTDWGNMVDALGKANISAVAMESDVWMDAGEEESAYAVGSNQSPLLKNSIRSGRVYFMTPATDADTLMQITPADLPDEVGRKIHAVTGGVVHVTTTDLSGLTSSATYFSEKIQSPVVTFKPAYTLEFNQNGGTGSVSDQTVTVTNSFSSEEPLPCPVKPNHTFMGWSVMPVSPSIPVAKDQKNAAMRSAQAGFIGNQVVYTDSVLYAVYYKHSYQIQYDGLYRSTNRSMFLFDVSNNTTAGFKHYNYDELATVTPIVPIREGATFLGWSKDANSIDELYQPGDSVDLYDPSLYPDAYPYDPAMYNLDAGDVAVRFYAKFDKCYISYNTEFLLTQNMPEDTVFDIGTQPAFSTQKPMRDAFVFRGWEYEGTVYKPGSVIPFKLYKDIEVKPYWVDLKAITITYDANGGENAPASEDVITEEEVTIPVDEPTCTHKKFLGWSTDPDATTPEYKPGVATYFDDDVTLYAVWATTYTLTFDAGEGLIDDSRTAQLDIPLGVGIKGASLTAPVPKLKGYIFAGWYRTGNRRLNVNTAYDEYITFTAKYVSGMLWNKVPIVVGGKPVVSQPHICTNGRWWPVAMHVYTQSQWQRTACPVELAFEPVAGGLTIPSITPLVAYTGSVVAPVVLGFNPDEIALTGQLEAVEVGTYMIYATPKNGRVWEDGSLTSKALVWSIIEMEEAGETIGEETEEDTTE